MAVSVSVAAPWILVLEVERRGALFALAGVRRAGSYHFNINKRKCLEIERQLEVDRIRESI